MDKIIVLPGKVNDVFFLNEIDYITKHFDEVVVISYPGDKENYRKIAKEKGFRYYIVRNNILKLLFNKNFYKWLFDKNTRDEIKKVFSLSRMGFLKILYILYYGIFYVEAKKFIDMEVKQVDNIYLYSFWLSRGAYTIANYNLNRRKSIKKILSRAHRYDLYEERNPINFLPFREFINRNLDEIHFISEHGLNYFTNNYKDTNLCSKKYISRLGTFNYKNLKKKINKKNIVCIASCSSIIPVKRLDLIVDVIANIDIPIKWIHIGTGSEENKIKAYAEKKLKDKWYQFFGYIDNPKIMDIYMEYDIDFFINLSDSEGIPVSIMEAISIGVPVIARDVGGNSEIVNNDVGLLITEDIKNMDLVFEDINEELDKRINNIELYKYKVENCIDLWNRNYNANKNFNDFFKGIKKDQGV